MTNFKITVTKNREGNTGNIAYTKDQLKEFSESLVFGETKKSMGDLVTFYTYKEVQEYIVDELSKDDKLSEIKAMLSGHIVFDIDIQETSKCVEKKEDGHSVVVIEAEEDLAMDSRYSEGYTEKLINGDEVDVVFNKTAAQYAKSAGIPSLIAVAELSGQSVQTLNNWLNNKPFIFHAVIEKAAKEFNMKFRIDYKYKENNNAFNSAWEHNFEIISAESEEQAKKKFKKLWTADGELVIKTVEKV